jgi:transposase
LEKGFNTKDAPDLSARCYIILLKAEGYTINEISKTVGLGCQKVSYWIKRFRENGIDGLNDVPKESIIKHDYLRGGYLHYY